jgi:hypothetical protein
LLDLGVDASLLDFQGKGAIEELIERNLNILQNTPIDLDHNSLIANERRIVEYLIELNA